jgi:hypothetical protein
VNSVKIVTGAGANKVLVSDADGNGAWTTFNWDPPPTATGCIGVSLDGQGGKVKPGFIQSIVIPYNCTINKWYLVSDRVGSIVLDVWKKAGGLPTVADTITGSEKPTLNYATSNSDVDLTTWTTSVSAGDVITFYVESCVLCQKATLSLLVTKT